ncbi:MAG: DEAD/DEAH box helicase family protein [Rickettsiales bacterium]
MEEQLSNTVDPKIKNRMMVNIRKYLAKSGHGMHDHQVEAIEQVDKLLRTPVGSSIKLPDGQKLDDEQEHVTKKGDFFEVVSATGTGKTRMFGSLTKAVDMPTLIVTPRNLLNKQTKHEFAEKIGINEDDIVVYDSKQSDRERKRLLEGNPPPKVVITSYQSMPSLIDRHEIEFTNPDDKHFRPLILLDEVHEAQGKKTAKFIKSLMGEALVGGFTATDAGAHKTLFNGQKQIFNLGLVPAIKQGLLCRGVETGVIDVKIDEDWVKDFQNTRAGSDYKQEDIEKFARTPAVINAAVEHHLTTDDDKLGKLSRLPTVFFTQGVKAAKEGAELYNKMAKELGVNSKAAYVSGEMKSSARDPIIADFKAGKIQSLFNDRVLEMGFDAPNATVCYSLKPTKMLHVVEQQLGRITRRQSKDYFDDYGINKTALAINVRPDGVKPKLFGHVLGGEPAVYRGRDEDGNPVPPPPTITPPTEPQWINGVRITKGYTHLKTLLDEKDDISLNKPEGWLSNVDMIDKYTGNNEKHKKVLIRFSEVKKQELVASGKSEDEATKIVHDEWVGEYSNNGKPAICASPQAILELEKHSIIVRKDAISPKPESWLSNTDMDSKYVGGKDKHKRTLLDFAEKKKTELIKSGKSKDEAAKIVHDELVGEYKDDRGQLIICLSPQAILELEKRGTIIKRDTISLKPDGWLSNGEMMGEYIGNDAKHKQTLRDFTKEKQQQLVASGKSEDEAKKIVQEEWVGEYKSVSKISLCASPQAIYELEKSGIIKINNNMLSKPENWLSSLEISNKYIGDPDTLKQKLLELAEEKKTTLIQSGKSEDEAAKIIYDEWVGEYKGDRGRPTIFASPKAIKELEEKLIVTAKDKVIPKPDGWLTNRSMTNEYAATHQTHKRILLDFAEKKRTELIKSGKSEDEATKIVHNEWIGEYNNSGKPAICASPRAIKELEKKGLLEKREQSFAEKVGAKKQPQKSYITPDSPQIKNRTGWHKGL